MLSKFAVGCSLLALLAGVASAQPNAIDNETAKTIPGLFTNTSRGDQFALPGAHLTGRWFDVSPVLTAGVYTLSEPNSLIAIPSWTGEGNTIKAAGFNIASTGVTPTWNYEFCLYADNGSGYPGALLAGGDSGAVQVVSASIGPGPSIGSGPIISNVVSFSSPVAVSGWLWVAFEYDITGSVISGASNPYSNVLFGVDSSANITQVAQGYSVSYQFSSCPAVYPAGAIIRQAANLMSPRLLLQY